MLAQNAEQCPVVLSLHSAAVFAASYPPPLNRGDVAFDFVLFCLKSGTLPKGVSMGGPEVSRAKSPCASA